MSFLDLEKANMTMCLSTYCGRFCRNMWNQGPLQRDIWFLNKHSRHCACILGTLPKTLRVDVGSVLSPLLIVIFTDMASSCSRSSRSIQSGGLDVTSLLSEADAVLPSSGDQDILHASRLLMLCVKQRGGKAHVNSEAAGWWIVERGNRAFWWRGREFGLSDFEYYGIPLWGMVRGNVRLIDVSVWWLQFRGQ